MMPAACLTTLQSTGKIFLFLDCEKIYRDRKKGRCKLNGTHEDCCKDKKDMMYIMAKVVCEKRYRCGEPDIGNVMTFISHEVCE
jgi:hypothetical protein